MVPTTILVIVVLSMLCVVRGKPFVSSEPINDLNIIRSCNMSSPVPLRMLNYALISKDLSQAKSNDFECFLFCLYNKYEFMDEEGHFRIDHMKEMLDDAFLEPALVEMLLYKCTAIDSFDKCHRAFLFTECFWAHSEKDVSEEANFLYHFK